MDQGPNPVILHFTVIIVRERVTSEMILIYLIDFMSSMGARGVFWICCSQDILTLVEFGVLLRYSS